MNYYQYVTRLAQESDSIQSDTDFAIVIPATIEYAEQRLYRELDLLAARVTAAAGQFSSGNRSLALSTAQGTFLVVESINAIIPAGTVSSAGTRVPLTPVDRSMIDATYGSNTANADDPYPRFFARVDNGNIIVGPPPNGAYYAEVIGTIRPSPLSSGNSSTILTTMLPDLFIVASMVFLAQRSNDPNMVAKWEGEYQKVFASANVEELRKRYMSNAWTSLQPSPIATPPRV